MNHTATARILAVAALMALAPCGAAAQTYTAELTPDNVVPNPGPPGASGLATIVFADTSVEYNLVFSGVEDPTAAHIHVGDAGRTGEVVVDLDPVFSGGFASGSVTADAATIAEIVDDPAHYYVQIHSADFPGGALRGQLSGGGSVVTTLYLPVVATVAGQAGTDFHTDARFVNRSGEAAEVTFSYYRGGAGGNPSGPSQTATMTIGPNEQLVLDDMATELFGVNNGKGGVKIEADRFVFGSARIYNDQRGAGAGTFGQWAQALSMGDARVEGAIQFLSNEDPDSGVGFRGNVGWFNPHDVSLELTLDAWDTSGAPLGSVPWTAGPYEQLQRNLGQLWSALSDYGDLYVTFTADMPIFVYGSLVDNVNGDAIYIPADN